MRSSSAWECADSPAATGEQKKAMAKAKKSGRRIGPSRASDAAVKRTRCSSAWPARSNLPLDHEVLDLADRFRRVEALRAGFRAIHARMATIKPERVFDLIEPLAFRLIARIIDPAIGLQQHGRTEIAVAVPPIAWARRRA